MWRSTALGWNFARSELPVRIEQSGVGDCDRLDRAAVLLDEVWKLSPGEYAFGDS
jgi:hypothetical protein